MRTRPGRARRLGRRSKSGLEGADEASGQEKQRADELEDAPEGEADEAEGEQDQPDEGIEDEGEQSQRPAEQKKGEEEQQLEHGRSPVLRGRQEHGLASGDAGTSWRSPGGWRVSTRV